jgi:hypothetical protein
MACKLGTRGEERMTTTTPETEFVAEPGSHEG